MNCLVISNLMACDFQILTPSSRWRKSAPRTPTNILISLRQQSPGRRRLETSCGIRSLGASGQESRPMSQNPTSKEVTKRAVLAELERLRQGRHARYQTLVGRFARCPEQKSVAALFAAAVEASARTHNRTPLDAPPGWLPPVS